MGMYSAIIIIDILVLCITAADAMTNRLLDKPVKTKFWFYASSWDFRHWANMWVI